MATSQSTLDNLVYSILREESDSSAYPLELVHSIENYAQRAICNWGVQNPLTWQEIQKWALPFLFTDKMYSSVKDWFLSADATVWWTTLDLDTTDFPSSGKVWISWNQITYTGKSATQFTWVTGIEFAFESGTRVSYMYALPSDYGSPVQMDYDGTFQIFWKDYRTIYKELNNEKNWLMGNQANNYSSNPDRFNSSTPAFYTIVNWTHFILFQISYTGKPLHFLYEKTPETITSIVSATIPDTYAEFVIPQMVVAEILYDRNEEDRASRILWRACGRISNMYRFYSKQNQETQVWNRVTNSRDSTTLNV